MLDGVGGGGLGEGGLSNPRGKATSNSGRPLLHVATLSICKLFFLFSFFSGAPLSAVALSLKVDSYI